MAFNNLDELIRQGNALFSYLEELDRKSITHAPLISFFPALSHITELRLRLLFRRRPIQFPSVHLRVEQSSSSSVMEKAKNYISEKVANMKKPEAAVTTVDLKSVHRDHIEYAAKVAVDNPYPTPLPICDITYVLKSDGRVIAHGAIPDPGSIKASGQTLLEVPVKVPHSILVSLVKDIGRDWDIDYELELGLVIDLPVFGNFTIPLSSKGEVKLPTLSDVFSSKK